MFQVLYPILWVDKVLGQGQNETLSEYVHAAYQINGNVVYDNLLAIILLSHILDLRGGIKRSKHFFSLKVAMLHIKLKGMKRRTQRIEQRINVYSSILRLQEDIEKC